MTSVPPSTDYREAVDEAGDNFVTGGYYLNKLGLLLRKEGPHRGSPSEAFRRLKTEFGPAVNEAAAGR